VKRHQGVVVDAPVDGYQLGLTAAPGPAVAEFLTTLGLAGRIDTTDQVTSLLLADGQFRPAPLTISLAAELAAATGSQVRLLRSMDAEAAAAGDGLVVQPDGSTWPLDEPGLAAAVAAVPHRVSRCDRWLLVGQVPQSPSLPELVGSVLPGADQVAAQVWTQAEGPDGQAWFVAEVTGPSEELPELVGDLASAIRGGRARPVLAFRISDSDATMLQPGARKWEEFPLVWGMRRSWVHPQWGIADVDQDGQVTLFAAAWTQAGGTVNEVNLRALSRRNALKARALEPALGALGAPVQVRTIASTLATAASAEDAALALGEPQVLTGLSLTSAIRAAWNEPARRQPRRAGAATRPSAVVRFLHGLAAVAAGCVVYRMSDQGISGWEWAWLVVLGGLVVDGLAGALGFTGASLVRTPPRYSRTGVDRGNVSPDAVAADDHEVAGQAAVD